jgi:hypothetical protein
MKALPTASPSLRVAREPLITLNAWRTCGGTRHVHHGAHWCVGGHMSIFIVRLGTPRKPSEGLRLGTVRRHLRGVPMSEFARLDYYDAWFPNLSPQHRLEGGAGSGGRADVDRIQQEVPRGDGRARSLGQAESQLHRRRFESSMRHIRSCRSMLLKPLVHVGYHVAHTFFGFRRCGAETLHGPHSDGAGNRRKLALDRSAEIVW